VVRGSPVVNSVVMDGKKLPRNTPKELEPRSVSLEPDDAEVGEDEPKPRIGHGSTAQGGASQASPLLGAAWVVT
jgi:hypothetical protein